MLLCLSDLKLAASRHLLVLDERWGLRTTMVAPSSMTKVTKPSELRRCIPSHDKTPRTSVVVMRFPATESNQKMSMSTEYGVALESSLSWTRVHQYLSSCRLMRSFDTLDATTIDATPLGLVDTDGRGGFGVFPYTEYSACATVYARAES